jgi:hypothetical protein
MPPSLLRKVWTRVEKTQTNILLHLDDASLAKHLVESLAADRCIETQDAPLVHTYIHTKLSLIRDMAQARLA